MTTDHKQRKDMPKIGQKFGKLTVLSKCEERYISPRGKIHIKWNCLCECGKRTTPDTGSLNSGKSKSCGCYLTPEGRLKRQRGRKEGASAGEIYSSYKLNARKRGHEFKISKAEAISIFKQNCHYCGITPSSVAKKCAIPFLYNGIDRKENTLGYTIENCVPCCSKCNRAKMTLPYEEFLGVITKIYHNLIEKNENKS